MPSGEVCEIFNKLIDYLLLASDLDLEYYGLYKYGTKSNRSIL